MPSDVKTAPVEEESQLAGKFFKCESEAERSDAIDKAFDFRGNVVLELASGEKVEGYMGNRDGKVIDLFPKGEDDIKYVNCADVVAIAFDAKDPADGKSWEAWMTKKASERKAEMEKLEQEAKERGEL